ncbi:hypothetical protein SAMN05660816_03651 [Niastella yeongjuensis]|nr:hypothetical protein SAMN05660816_03651 [Niastella yeongjuensis]
MIFEWPLNYLTKLLIDTAVSLQLKIKKDRISSIQSFSILNIENTNQSKGHQAFFHNL